VKPHDRLSVFIEIKKERDWWTDDQDISGPYLLQRLAGSTRRRGKLLGPLIRLDIGLILKRVIIRWCLSHVLCVYTKLLMDLTYVVDVVVKLVLLSNLT